MSAKWRALQHRHRYTYNAVVFPQSYIDSLKSIQLQQQQAAKFFTKLADLVSLNSIYAQVNHAKKVASAFSDLLINADEYIVSTASRFYLEVLFCENSLPLHRTLVSGLAKSRNFQSVIGLCFRKLCVEYGGVQQSGGKRFCVSRVALSVMGIPKLGYLVDIVEECAVLVAWDIYFSLNSVVLEENEWARPSPIVMEQCQEALSCSYYLLQRFPSKFQDNNDPENGVVGEDSSVLEMLVTVVLSILKSSAFSRDCFVAAGVSFCAALQVCLSPEELGLFIIQGIFYQTTCSSISNFERESRNDITKIPYKGDLYSEIRNFPVLSRLSLIRGILTAISRPVLNIQFAVAREILNGCDASINSSNSVKTILYDGILPELCNYCENPTDSHFNFHVLTVMQICLQQMKTSMQSNLCQKSSSYYPLPEKMRSRLLRIIWNNLEDPLSQTVKQVHLIFDLFLDIQSTLHWPAGGERITAFLQKIALDLLRLGPRCKGRYVPLASLTKRLGARSILNMSPSLLYETVRAYVDDDVCCAVTSFLKCFLEYLRDECWSSNGIESGYALYRRHCLPPILYGLASGVSKLRSNLNTYALPMLFEVDLDIIFPMLAFISIGPSVDENGLLDPELACGKIELNVEQKVAILVSLLKVSRCLALIEGDIDWLEDPTLKQKQGNLGRGCLGRHAVVCVKGVEVEILVEWLVLALTHVDESLRVDAAETLFLNPKTASLPSRLELSLLKEAMPLNMRCCSTAFQMKWTSMFRKFFSRVKTALERQLKQGNWKPLADCANLENSLSNGSEEIVIHRANELFVFMKWLSCFLFFSCYPSAPYKRKTMAMELILIMLSVWSVVMSSQEECGSFSPSTCLYPYNKGFTLPDSILLLVGSIVDSWDRLRVSSFRILLHFPTPLPGISSQDMVCKLIAWAKNLVCSQRVRESDAGALTLRLIFRKYVLELGWKVRVSGDITCVYPHSDMANGGDEIYNTRYPVIEYLKSVIDWLNAVVEEGNRDLSEACKNSFVHGILLTLRYTFEEMDWNSDVEVSSISEMRLALDKLLELVMRITSLALWVVSADAWYLPEDMDDVDADDTYLLDVQDEVDICTPSPEDADKRAESVRDNRTSEQIVMVGCWLAMKEVSLLLGTIIRKIPLPNSKISDSIQSSGTFSNASAISDEVLDLDQLKAIGNHFLEVLLKMKHNGAIDKTRAGFTALCNRLLCSNDPSLCKLTETWMEQLMERSVAEGQTVDNLLRRSAGIPAAFMALFLSEPDGAPKKLLPWALRWLIDVANKLLFDSVETEHINGDFSKLPPVNLNQYPKSSLAPEMDTSEKTSKIRDEGVIPTVHAFNVLRAAFNDTNLSTDTSGFAAEALIVTIRAFSSCYWEVRNSACLAYTALVRRTIGFLNVQKRESARRAVTGLEYFHRYPSLHQFLLNELKVATELLDDGSAEHSQTNLAKVVHPSLCPVLILLSRLKPSTIASETGDELDPFLFMQFIRRCSTQSNQRVRVLASRALTCVVSNEKLCSVLLNIASELPCVNHPELAMATDPSVLFNSTKGKNRHASFNWIHGILLQLSSLLDLNCRNLADFLKKDQILIGLVQVLSKCSWLAKPRWCQCPILNASFLLVLDHMLSIGRTCQESKSSYTIRNLLLESSTECLDVEASYGLSYYDPTVAELRKQAAISYFSCVFQPFKEDNYGVLQMPPRSQPNVKLLETPVVDSPFSGLQERLIRSLQDTSYEVRLATLKWLLSFLKSTESGFDFHDLSSHEIRIIQQWTKLDLQVTLTNLLTVEKNHRCTQYILKILFVWNSLQFQKFSNENRIKTVFVGEMDCDQVVRLWDKLISSYKQTRHAKIWEAVMCCMGICIKQVAGLLSNYAISGIGEADPLEKLYSCISHFADLVKQHSAPSEPVNMRKAAAESIIASGLLEQAKVIGDSVINNKFPAQKFSVSPFEPKEVVNMYAHQILDVWFTCIKLLEDEDDGIRQKLAMDVQKCSNFKTCGGISSHVPFQVEKVIGSSFEYLSSIFGHWIEYFEHLLKWVLNVANFAVSQGDLVRRVFDKEIDNFHEEKLLISQICCSHLEKLSESLESMDEKWFRNYLLDWRVRFSNRLISFAENHIGKQGGVDWIGGVGNHKDAFLPLYGNLLGFYTVSICILNRKTDEGMPLLPKIIEIGKIIGPFLRNPLISNLYLLVIKIHKKFGGIVTDHLILDASREDDSIWDGFDPYFLLR